MKHCSQSNFLSKQLSIGQCGKFPVTNEQFNQPLNYCEIYIQRSPSSEIPICVRFYSNNAYENDFTNVNIRVN